MGNILCVPNHRFRVLVPADLVTANIVRKVETPLNQPVYLPVSLRSPFGLFGDMTLKSRSRAGSAERDDEDKGLGIANENFFTPSERFFSFLTPQLLYIKNFSAFA